MHLLFSALFHQPRFALVQLDFERTEFLELLLGQRLMEEFAEALPFTRCDDMSRFFDVFNITNFRHGVQALQKGFRRTLGFEVDVSAGRFAIERVILADDLALLQEIPNLVVRRQIVEVVPQIRMEAPVSQIQIGIRFMDVCVQEFHVSRLPGFEAEVK